MRIIFIALKGKDHKPRILYAAKLSSRNGQVKILIDKLREFVTSRTAQKRNTKEMTGL